MVVAHHGMIRVAHGKAPATFMHEAKRCVGHRMHRRSRPPALAALTWQRCSTPAYMRGFHDLALRPEMLLNADGMIITVGSMYHAYVLDY